MERWSRLFGFFEQIHLDPDLTARSGGSEADHRAIWLVCSPEERLGLYHIAKNGFISPRFPELPDLFQRGLVFRQSQLSLVSPSFARFVRESFPPEISRLRAIEEKDSIWNAVKGPVKTVLFIFSLLMFLTQRELFNSVAESTATLAGAVPKLLDLLRLFQKAPKP